MYVDDIIITGAFKAEINILKSHLDATFKLKDLLLDHLKAFLCLNGIILYNFWKIMIFWLVNHLSCR